MRQALLAISIALAATAASTAHAESTEWVVEAKYADAQALARAASHFQHVRVNRKQQTLRVETDERGIELLRSEGLDVTVDLVASAELHQAMARAETARRAGVVESGASGYPGIPGYPCYRTVEGTYQTMDDLVAAHPGLVEIDAIGPSWKKTQNAAQGYEMRALRITNLATAAADPDRPKLVAFSSIHAREYAPAELMTRFAEWLVNGYGIDPEATWLVDHNDFRLILQANPDGRKQAETGLSWRKNTNNIDGACGSGNSIGIDLNRNFPFHWNITNGVGSSGNTCSETFRGPLRQSEPETENLMGYVAGTCNLAGECTGGVFTDRRSGSMDPASGNDDGGAAPDDTRGIFFDMHSYSDLVLWSWGDTAALAPNGTQLRTLGRRMAWFNQYDPQPAVELYPTDGTTDDSMYGLLGVPAYTFELDDAFFQSCSSFEGDTLPKNINALRYSARALHAPYLLPKGPDTVVVDANGADLVAAGTSVDISAQLDSSRFRQGNPTEPVYPIASVNAYLDQLPWDAGASALAMSAADGAFDSNSETATLSLNTTGWSSGRHFVHVQGVAANTGQAGTPNAAYVDVAAAGDIATLSGTVTARDGGAPLAASVTVSNAATGEIRSADTNPADGAYTRRMLAGNVAVHVSAPGYLDEDLPAVGLVGTQTTVRNFAMLSRCTVFEDAMENGSAGWVAQVPWSIVGNVPGNITQVWSTGTYGNNVDTRLTTSATIDLTGFDAVALEFDDRCDTENNYDFGYAEYSIDGGNQWSRVYACDGRPSWQTQRVALPANASGSSGFKLRFRLESDGSITRPGWSIDNVRVTAGGEACRAQQLDDTIFVDGFDNP
jgi:carboxypeptidase T